MIMSDSKSHILMLVVEILIIADKMHDTCMSFIWNVTVLIFRVYYKREHFIAKVKTQTKIQ